MQDKRSEIHAARAKISYLLNQLNEIDDTLTDTYVEMEKHFDGPKPKLVNNDRSLVVLDVPEYVDYLIPLALESYISRDVIGVATCDESKLAIFLHSSKYVKPSEKQEEFASLVMKRETVVHEWIYYYVSDEDWIQFCKYLRDL